MYKHTVTYVDFNDNECKENLYFNFTKKELNDMEKSGYAETIQDAKRKVDAKELEGIDLYGIVSTFVLMAYGRKSDDGKRFVKDPCERNAFADSCAFEAMVDELLSNIDTLEAFMIGVMPKSLADKVSEEYEKNKAELTAQLNV